MLYSEENQCYIVKKIVAISIEFCRKIILLIQVEVLNKNEKYNLKYTIISWQGYKFGIIYLNKLWQNIVKRILLYVLIEREFNP